MRLAIVGTGLIGTSVALAARGRGDDVVGWDPDPDVLARSGLAAAGSLEEAVAGVDMVVVAAPIAQLPGAVRAALEASGDATVTDVGSTKASVVAAADGSPRFVGGHPIAGAETQGPDNASAGLTASCTVLPPILARRPSRSTPTRTTGSSR
jgi:prephenate dehydrogenase